MKPPKQPKMIYPYKHNGHIVQTAKGPEAYYDWIMDQATMMISHGRHIQVRDRRGKKTALFANDIAWGEKEWKKIVQGRSSRPPHPHKKRDSLTL